MTTPITHHCICHVTSLFFCLQIIADAFPDLLGIMMDKVDLMMSPAHVCDDAVHVELGGSDMKVAGSNRPFPEGPWEPLMAQQARNRHTRTVRNVARAHVVPIPHTASRRSRFLETLVRNPNVPLSVFKSPVVVATIHFKWHQYASRMYRTELVVYMVYYLCIMITAIGGVGMVQDRSKCETEYAGSVGMTRYATGLTRAGPGVMYGCLAILVCLTLRYVSRFLFLTVKLIMSEARHHRMMHVEYDDGNDSGGDRYGDGRCTDHAGETKDTKEKKAPAAAAGVGLGELKVDSFQENMAHRKTPSGHVETTMQWPSQRTLHGKGAAGGAKVKRPSLIAGLLHHSRSPGGWGSSRRDRLASVKSSSVSNGSAVGGSARMMRHKAGQRKNPRSSGLRGCCGDCECNTSCARRSCFALFRLMDIWKTMELILLISVALLVWSCFHCDWRYSGVYIGAIATLFASLQCAYYMRATVSFGPFVRIFFAVFSETRQFLFMYVCTIPCVEQFTVCGWSLLSELHT